MTDNNHRYFILLPWLIDESGLSLAAFRLYARIKKVAGENGVCFESQDWLAEICCMSTKTLIRAKRELKKAGLISITKETNAGRVRDIISPTDIWSENQLRFSEVKETSGSKLDTDRNSLLESKEDKKRKQTRERVRRFRERRKQARVTSG